MMKTETLCHFSQDGYKLKLVRESKLVKTKLYPNAFKITYRVTLNRKIQGKSISEYTMRKLFALMSQNIVLQLKIY